MYVYRIALMEIVYKYLDGIVRMLHHEVHIQRLIRKGAYADKVI